MAGLYIHVPFCHSKCAYCDFYSRPSKDSDALYGCFAEALIKEYQERVGNYLTGCDKFATAYVGGGTPSILPAETLEYILERVIGDIDSGGEITMECNPEDVTDDKVKGWLGCGINRISMGIQSFIDEELKAVGRRHLASEAENAVNLLRKAGVRNLSLDLIYGLPYQTIESWKLSVDRMISLRPEHFSAYALSVEKGTRLYAQMIAGRFVPVSDDIIVGMYKYLCNAARAAGYEHYEISNFALPGYRACHNSSYWHDEPYLGIGPSAVSFDGYNKRITNPNNLKNFIDGISNDRDIEYESQVDRVNDVILTSLRTSDGLEMSRIKSLSDEKTADMIWNIVLDKFRTECLIDEQRKKLSIAEDNWLMSDMIIRELLIEEI